jgi:hypothetical protein
MEKTIPERYSVREIEKDDCKPFLLNRHYARRLCPMTYCFGLFNDGNLIGVSVFGGSANRNNNQIGDYKVIELNRLFTEDGLEKNVLSYFVSRSLSLVPKPHIVLSYADPNNGHHGFIYQATNWLYIGQGHRQDGTKDSGVTQFTKDGKQFHAKTVFSLIGSSSKVAAEANGFERQFLPPKHKYCFLVADKRDRKKMLSQIKYPILPYPKGHNRSYDTGC